MIPSLGLIFTLAGTLPILNFQVGQIPGYFGTPDFFALISQIVTSILGGLSSGILGAIVDAIFGVTNA